MAYFLCLHAFYCYLQEKLSPWDAYCVPTEVSNYINIVLQVKKWTNRDAVCENMHDCMYMQ